jgi:sugar lactone lactonase YvrE
METTHSDTTFLVGGLSFTEGPRWRSGRLWFSDAHAGRVLSLGDPGDCRVEAILSGPCSGLGWRENGALLVLLTQRRAVVTVVEGQEKMFCDLTAFMPGSGTELITDRKGRAYVGNSGFDMRSNEAPRSTHLILVDEAGSARSVADALDFPNGTVITPDERTLIIAESIGRRLSAYDVGKDGALSHRRTVAELGDILPDGICLDAEGAVWVASPNSKQVVRVTSSGKIDSRISTGERGAYACMLGGNDRKTLYVATGGVFEFGKTLPKQPAGIESVRVSVPGDGIP